MGESTTIFARGTDEARRIARADMADDGNRDAQGRGRDFWIRAEGERAPPRGIFGDVPAIVTITAGLLALLYGVMELLPSATSEAIADRFGLAPLRLVEGLAGEGGAIGLFAPFFTHILIHATLTHLLFNLLWLFVFGTPIARRLGASWRFWLFFAACGAAGGAFFSLFHLSDPTLLIGASGGISGLLGGLVRFAFHRPYSRPASEKGVLPLTDRSVLTWSAVVIGMNASVAIVGPGVGAGDADIAWQAHVGGYLAGLILFPLVDPRRR